MLLNRFSFLLFSTIPPEPAHLLNLPGGGSYSPCAASVIIVPGETYSFYIAAATAALTGGSFGLFRLNGSQATGAVGGVTSVFVDAVGTTHYKANVTVPAGTGIAEGYYRLKIGVYFSPLVWFRKSGYESGSALFSFRNRRPVGPIAYDLPELNAFRNVLRLKCYLSETATETDLETYELITTGSKRVVESKTHHALKITAPNTDTFGHEGWRTMLAHKDLLINNKRYVLKTGYSESEPVGYLATGSFEVWDSDYSVINQC